MSDEAESSAATRPEPTDARFTLRELFVVMTLTAVLAAIGGAMLKQFSPEVRPRVVVYWVIWLFTVIACVSVQFWLRRRAEQKAGPILLRVAVDPPFGTLRGVLQYVLTTILVLYLLSIGTTAFVMSTAGSDPFELATSVAFPLLISVVLSVTLVTPALLWHREIRFCEAGILWGCQVLYWGDLMEYRWVGSKGDNKLELFGAESANIKPWLRASISVVWKADVNGFLKMMVERIPFASSRVRAVGVGQVPILTVFRTPHLRRHLGHVFVSLICGLALWLLVIARPAGWGEFSEALSVGIYLYIFLMFVQWKWVGRNAGPLIVRVFARRDWLGLVGNVAGAVAIYLAIDQMILSWGWLGYLGGLAYCYLAINALGYFFLTQLDLRANGIVIPRALYWPWAEVNGLKWARAETGGLVLRRGWRRVYATVPPEQREAVDRELKEKLEIASTPNP